MTGNIPITKSVLDESDLAALRTPIDSGWVVQGPQVAEFEKLFAAFSGSRHAIATTSCTTALHVSMAALGIGPGDEVVVPAFTFIASANAVEYLSARPMFCDVELDTFNASADSMRAAVGPRTKALMPVHLFGLPVQMEGVLELARARGLRVVEDAACAMGSRLAGKHVGNFGELGCFSFHPRKAITTGEGGMILTDSDELAMLCRSLRDHGAARSDRDRHAAKGAFLLADYPRLGFNYRMTDIQGALGVSQMAKARSVLERRAARARRYDHLLSDLAWLSLPVRPANADHSYQSYVCLFQPETPTLAASERLCSQRNKLMARLESEGIATRQGTQAVHATDYYRRRYKIEPEDFPNALIAERASLALPLYADMTDEEQDRVAAALKAAFAATRCAA